MNIPRRSLLIPLQVVLLVLMLFSSSGSLFGANSPALGEEVVQNDLDAERASRIDKQKGLSLDSVLATNKEVTFWNDNFGSIESLKNQILYHNNTSQQYIKRFQHVIPSLGVKEIIFPFHVFL